MNWRNMFRRANLTLGLISLVLALWAGMHLQHLLDDAGNRHAGETVVGLLLTLLAFAASRYGARLETSRD